MTLTFIGHGYVGLVTAAVFADLGNTVWVVGHTPEKITALKEGKTPFFEPGLEELVQKNVTAGRLQFTLNYDDAIPATDVIFICVGTPQGGDGRADLSTVFSVAEQIGLHLPDATHKVVVVKSTVPPGTNIKVADIIQKTISTRNSDKKNQAKFDIASCPEFLREGTAINDTLHPDRIVLGSESQLALQKLTELHSVIDAPVITTNLETAEMIKYVANSILSTKISFANAIATICEKVHADVKQVMDGVGLDQRIGRSFLDAGVGYGGSCFPKDVRALIAFADDVGYNFSLLKAVDDVNNSMITHFVAKIVDSLDGSVKGKTIAIWGLSFKPNTDDMREAPAVKIIQQLQGAGAHIKAYDPEAVTNAKKKLQNVQFCAKAVDAVEKADALAIITEWNEFMHIDLEEIKKIMNSPIIIDGRNIYDPDKMKQLGFIYSGVGR